MKIRFGSNGNLTAILVAVVAFCIGVHCMYYQAHLSRSHDLILKSQPSNVTSTILNRKCGLPYDDYRCSVLSITPNISKFCLDDVQITGMRLLPLLSFVLQL